MIKAKMSLLIALISTTFLMNTIGTLAMEFVKKVRKQTCSFVFIVALSYIFIILNVAAMEESSKESIPFPFKYCDKVTTYSSKEILIDGLPQVYFHCSIPEQMKLYRRVYDAIKQIKMEAWGTPENSTFDSSERTSPSAMKQVQTAISYQSQLSNMDLDGRADQKNSPRQGLREILENAFALVNYSITNDDSTSKENKIKYLNVLKKVHDALYKIQNERVGSFYKTPLFTIKEFEHFNLILAHIMESYNSKKDTNYLIIYHHFRMMYEKASEYLPLIHNLQWPYIIFLFDDDLNTWRNELKTNIIKLIKAVEEGRSQDDVYSNLTETQKSFYLKALKELDTDLANIVLDKNLDKSQNTFNTLLGRYNLIYNYYNRNQNIKEDMLNILESNPLEFTEKDNNNILFVIYGHPNRSPNVMRGINKNHFIEQCINPEYSAFIAYFDPISICPECGGNYDLHRLPNSGQAERKGKEPHYGSTEGTYQMFVHDILHAVLQQEEWMESPYPRSVIRSLLHHINHRSKDTATNTNEKNVINQALFMMIHEIPIFCEAAEEIRNINDYITDQVSLIKEFLKFTDDSLLKMSVRRYKEDNIDWVEGIADLTDGKGNPFFRKDGAPYDPINNLYVEEEVVDGKYTIKYQEAVENSFERFWDYYKEISLRILSDH